MYFSLPVTEDEGKKEVFMSPYECMICGSREHVLREGPLCLCTCCLAALGQALGDKLPCMAEGGQADPPLSA